MRDLAEEFRRVAFLLERIALIRRADDFDLVRDNFPRLSLSLRRNEIALHHNRRSRLQTLHVRIIPQPAFRDDLKTAQTRTVVQLDERKILRVAPSADPALDLHARDWPGTGERSFDGNRS